MAQHTKQSSSIVGGGARKILYTLSTINRMGVGKSVKALRSNNTCKACALGMGGQRGGMTNELDEYPAVCNKSVQAQSTDIQSPIPEQIFDYKISDFRELTAQQLESMGRLNTPLYKPTGGDQYQPVNWDFAINKVAEKFKAALPDNTFFYSSGRSSNEAGFVLQLMARLYGTNNINNCSYYCHQASGVGMSNTVGTGTATIELEDLTGCDLIFVIGANPASNHPRFIHKLKDCRDRGGDVIVINPAKEPGLVRFALPKSPKSLISGGSWIASDYLQPNIGSDHSVFTGIAKAVVEAGGEVTGFIQQYTDGYEGYLQQLQHVSWGSLCEETGLNQSDFRRIADRYIRSEKTVFAWGMGITHHRCGVENVEAIVNLALLRGMIGQRYAGLLPLRGHSNVQGIGTIGVKPVLAKTVFENIQSHFGVELPISAGMDTLGGLQAASVGKIDAALIMGGNLFEATPDQHWAQQALDRIDFKVFLTTTLNRGHLNGVDTGECVVLPVTARDEEPEPTSQESMFNFVRLSDGGIERLDNVRSETQILCELAKQILPDCPVDFDSFSSSHSIREAIAKTVPGMSELADLDVARQEFHIQQRLLHKPEFNTSSGKARFVHHTFRASDKAIGIDDDFPFRLSSVRSEGQFNSIIYEAKDSYRGADSRDVVFIGQQDLDSLGLHEGDTIKLTSGVGEIPKLTVKAFDLPVGNLMAYYPEANVLIGRETDPLSKTPAFKSVAVRIDKI